MQGDNTDNQGQGSTGAAAAVPASAAVPSTGGSTGAAVATTNETAQERALQDEVARDTAGLLDDDAGFSDLEDADIGLEVEDRTEFTKVSSLSFEKKQEKLKEFWKTSWQHYNIGDYLDAQDTVNKWMLARIVEADDAGVVVRFDGWPARWDLRFGWSSYRINPLRRCSVGYTGQPKAPLRPKFVFDE